MTKRRGSVEERQAQVGAFTTLQDKARSGAPFDENDRELLCDVADLLPPLPGRPLTHSKRIDAEVRRFWLVIMRDLKQQGVPATDAHEQAAHAIRKRWPEDYGERSTKTIVDRMQRRKG